MVISDMDRLQLAMPLNDFMSEVASEPVSTIEIAITTIVTHNLDRLQLAMPLNGFVPEVANEPVSYIAFAIAQTSIRRLPHTSCRADWV